MANRKKNAAAVALGRLGGLKGGKARARKLSAEQLRESARKAALARWDGYQAAVKKRKESARKVLLTRWETYRTAVKRRKKR